MVELNFTINKINDEQLKRLVKLLKSDTVRYLFNSCISQLSLLLHTEIHNCES